MVQGKRWIASDVKRQTIRLHKSRTEELSAAQIRICILELVTYLCLTVIIFCTLGGDLRLNLLNLNLITRARISMT